MAKWEMVRLGDVATFINGYAFKPKDWSNEGLPIIRIQNLTGSSNEINYYNKEYDLRYEVNYDDVLISWSASLGVYKWKFGKALLNQHIFKVYFDKLEIDKNYFIYTIRQLLSDMEKETHGSTMKHITKGRFDNLPFPLPPLETQQKIADALDCASALIEKRKAQIEKLDLLVKSQFVEMFGDPVTNPRGWEIVNFDQFITFLTSGSRGWSQYFTTEGSIFLTIKNIKNSKLKLDNIQYVCPPNNKEAERTKVQENDLIISITADLGRTCVISNKIARKGAYINQHLSLVRLNFEKINPFYVSYFLESPAGRLQFEAKNQIGVKSGLNFDAIKSLKILVPPTSLQNEFAAFVEQVEGEKQRLQDSLEKLERNYQSLMQKCFRGEIF